MGVTDAVEVIAFVIFKVVIFILKSIIKFSIKMLVILSSLAAILYFTTPELFYNFADNVKDMISQPDAFELLIELFCTLL